MSTAADMTSRKPLDADFVGKINQQAMRALADNGARRKWGNSRSGSPLTTNILCAEIARLNILQERTVAALRAIVDATQSSVPDALAASRANEIAMRAIRDATGADIKPEVKP